MNDQQNRHPTQDPYQGPVWRCPWCTTVYASEQAANWCDCEDDN